MRNIAYAYTEAGQLESVVDPISASEYHYTYDALGRLQTSSNEGTGGVPTTVLTYGYQPQNRKRTVSANVNGVNDFLNTYTYDVLGRVIQVRQQDVAGGNHVEGKIVDFAYTALGQFSQINHYLDLGTEVPVLDSSSVYNASGDLLSLGHKRFYSSSNLPFSWFTYSWNYDAAGRITAFHSPTESTTYAYDATSQLTGADHSLQADEAYEYDANGNREMPGYVTAGNKRLMSDGTFTFQYDAEGRRIQQTEIATGDTVDYEWDYRSRLTLLTFKDSSGVVEKRIRYTYDAFDRRIRKELDGDGNGTYESGQAFVYDGANIVLVADETGSLTNRYLHGPAVDQILADEVIGENALTWANVYWAITDNQGTVRYWARYLGGQLSWTDRIDYNAYGDITSHTDASGQPSTRPIHYAYTGREWDADANLYYYRARWYDAQSGRFISEDPLGFAAGDTNVQRYVGNSPTNATDPSGLQETRGPGGFSRVDRFDSDDQHRPAPQSANQPPQWHFQPHYGTLEWYIWRRDRLYPNPFPRLSPEWHQQEARQREAALPEMQEVAALANQMAPGETGWERTRDAILALQCERDRFYAGFSQINADSGSVQAIQNNNRRLEDREIIYGSSIHLHYLTYFLFCSADRNPYEINFESSLFAVFGANAIKSTVGTSPRYKYWKVTDQRCRIRLRRTRLDSTEDIPPLWPRQGPEFELPTTAQLESMHPSKPVLAPNRIGGIANDIAGGIADEAYVRQLEAILKKQTRTRIDWRSRVADNVGNHFDFDANVIHLTTGRTNTVRGVLFEEIQHALDFQVNPNWVRRDLFPGGNNRLHAGTFNRLANNSLFELTHDEMKGFLRQADDWAISSGRYFTWEELGITGGRGIGPAMPPKQR